MWSKSWNARMAVALDLQLAKEMKGNCDLSITCTDHWVSLQKTHTHRDMHNLKVSVQTLTLSCVSNPFKYLHTSLMSTVSAQATKRATCGEQEVGVSWFSLRHRSNCTNCVEQSWRIFWITGLSTGRNTHNTCKNVIKMMFNVLICFRVSHCFSADIQILFVFALICWMCVYYLFIFPLITTEHGGSWIVLFWSRCRIRV